MEDEDEEEGEEEAEGGGSVEDEDESAEEEEADGGRDEEVPAHDFALVKQVDTIEQTWELWSPTDPMHLLLKHAIDNTPVSV